MNLQHHNRIGILGIGEALPSHQMPNSDFLSRGLDTSEEWIESRSGIQNRHIIDSNQTTSILATESAKHAIAASGIDQDMIDFIIVATATPDHYGFPSTACLVQKHLNLSRKIPCFDLTAACSGFAYGVSTGYSKIASGLGKYGLIIGAESLSSIVDWSDRSSCILFGDGAGAAIIGPVETGGLIAINEGSDGHFSHILSTQLRENSELHNQQKPPYPRPIIEMDGRAVFKKGIQFVEQTITALFESSDLSISDVDFFAAHQANIRILESISENFSIPFEKFLVNIDEVGNTSAASIPLVLSRNINNQTISKNDIICLIGFGAGFTWSSILLEWSY